jgi:Uma2 family endonuclease
LNGQAVWCSTTRRTKEVHQFINGEPETVNIYKGTQKLDVTALFPGLELTTNQIFALPDWAE